jgi:hypothetical protein
MFLEAADAFAVAGNQADAARCQAAAASLHNQDASAE